MEVGADEVEVLAAMFPGPDGEPPQDLLAGAAALRDGRSVAFVLRLPLLPNVSSKNIILNFSLLFSCSGIKQ